MQWVLHDSRNNVWFLNKWPPYSFINFAAIQLLLDRHLYPQDSNILKMLLAITLNEPSDPNCNRKPATPSNAAKQSRCS